MTDNTTTEASTTTTLVDRLRGAEWQIDTDDPQRSWAHPDDSDAPVLLAIDDDRDWQPDDQVGGATPDDHRIRVHLVHRDGGEVEWPGVIPNALWESYQEDGTLGGAGSISPDEETPERLAALVHKACRLAEEDA